MEPLGGSAAREGDGDVKAPALVITDDDQVAVGNAEIVWPGETRGTWEVTVEGLEDAYFAQTMARVAVVIGDHVFGGDAMPVKVFEEAVTGKRWTTFVGNGPLDEA